MSVSRPEVSASPLNFADISTHASVLRDTNRMVLRYSDAILAYATALVRRLGGTPQDAEDIHMAVVQTMLEGKFARQPTPDAPAGRFRAYAKQAVRHAVSNHQRGRSRKEGQLHRLWQALWQRGAGAATSIDDDVIEEADRINWHEKVLSRVMKALSDYQAQHQDSLRPNVYHSLARLLLDHPGEKSDELAERLSAEVGREYTAGNTRQIILRLRIKFAELCVSEVAQMLDEPTYENALDELGELGLLAYVAPYLEARDTTKG